MKDVLQNIINSTQGNLMMFLPLMVIVLTLLIFTVTIFLLIRQYFFRRKAAKHIKVSKYYNDLLIECLFSSDENITENCKLKSKNGKHLIFESVLFLMQNFNGEFSEKLKTLFYDLKLEKYLLKNLRSNKWWLVARGLRNSRIMGYTEAVVYAERHINSGHLELRVEAQISIISLKTHDPFYFLNRLIKPFSLWARINLYQEISKWEEKPDATKWLSSTNPGVLVFALRIMGILDQRSEKKDTEPLVNHDDSMVRAEIIRYAALIKDKDLWLKGALKFKTENTLVRKIIGQTGGMLEDIPEILLINWFNWEKSTIVKIELARSMLIHGQKTGLNRGELEALGVVA